MGMSESGNGWSVLGVILLTVSFVFLVVAFIHERDDNSLFRAETRKRETAFYAETRKREREFQSELQSELSRQESELRAEIQRKTGGASVADSLEDLDDSRSIDARLDAIEREQAWTRGALETLIKKCVSGCSGKSGASEANR